LGTEKTQKGGVKKKGAFGCLKHKGGDWAVKAEWAPSGGGWGRRGGDFPHNLDVLCLKQGKSEKTAGTLGMRERVVNCSVLRKMLERELSDRVGRGQ